MLLVTRKRFFFLCWCLMVVMCKLILAFSLSFDQAEQIKRSYESVLKHKTWMYVVYKINIYHVKLKRLKRSCPQYVPSQQRIFICVNICHLESDVILCQGMAVSDNQRLDQMNRSSFQLIQNSLQTCPKSFCVITCKFLSSDDIFCHVMSFMSSDVK